ncbi:serine hydrolase domain-containing protein [Pseudoalteromonas luteoviolacea]|uniref:Beta-lactamase-related domain-containing protein n=1 Tax=Pseudoalteromonas luteoviolacea S4060-1 TaxID=1365257 RepID=A0A161YT97_9GAMM|nr:serine hydrolase domain-containing protein [Pseudoalteromonas luteoviolacea]KZN65560.1 hypothetical protein N478_20895 [Pseudoalteromonas luteoviolacea S4060-1]
MNQVHQQQFRFLFLCFISVFLSACFKDSIAKDYKITAEKKELFEKTFNEYCEKKLFFGSVYVTSGEQVVYESNCGPRNMQEYTSDPERRIGANSADSKYRIGSNTKEFAAAALLNILDGEDLRKKTIGDYLKWFPDNECKKVSLHNLLSMSSGIKDYSSNPEVYLNWGWRPYLGNQSLDFNGPEEFTNMFCSCSGLTGNEEQESSLKQGSKFEYSNCNYYLIGNIIEQHLAGHQGDISPEFYFGNIIERKILKPLNMLDSGTFNALGIYEKMTTGYVYRENPYLPCAAGRLPNTGGPEPYQNILKNPYSNPMVLYSAGDMYSTVKDMHKWDQGLYGDLVLNTDQKERAFSPYQRTNNKSQCEYFGYGWFITYIPKKHGKKLHCPKHPSKHHLSMEVLKQHERYLHYSGSYPYSWVTNFSRLVERNQAVMVFSNYNQTGLETDCIAEEIRNIIFYGEQHQSDDCQSILSGGIEDKLNDFKNHNEALCKAQATLMSTQRLDRN